MQIRRVELCGVQFHSLNESECVEFILDQVDLGRGGLVVTPNVDILRQCVANEQLLQIVQSADLVVPDGMPLVWASRLRQTPLQERVAGSNLIQSLSAAAALRRRSIFLLGGEEDTAIIASEALCQKSPSLIVAGTYYPPFGFENDPEEFKNISNALQRTQPDLIFVALSFPKGEQLIQQLRKSLPAAWWIGVGISFSFLAGRIPRAPRWMQNIGLEWVHRLFHEPTRLFERYIIHDIPFACRLFVHSLLTRRSIVRSKKLPPFS